MPSNIKKRELGIKLQKNLYKNIKYFIVGLSMKHGPGSYIIAVSNRG